MLRPTVLYSAVLAFESGWNFMHPTRAEEGIMVYREYGPEYDCHVITFDGTHSTTTDNKDGTFTIKNNKGEELTCNVLFTFDSDEFKKSYIVFTDNTTDENGKIKVYANTYDPSGNDINLGQIETDKEWEVIEGLLASLQEKIGEESGEENK